MLHDFQKPAEDERTVTKIIKGKDRRLYRALTYTFFNQISRLDIT